METMNAALQYNLPSLVIVVLNIIVDWHYTEFRSVLIFILPNRLLSLAEFFSLNAIFGAPFDFGMIWSKYVRFGDKSFGNGHQYGKHAVSVCDVADVR